MIGRRYNQSIQNGGNINEPKNYRGITLNNIMAKIYSKLLVERLSKWTEKHNTLIDNQYGFQKGKSTVNCICIVHALITKHISKQEETLYSIPCLIKSIVYTCGKNY